MGEYWFHRPKQRKFSRLEICMNLQQIIKNIGEYDLYGAVKLKEQSSKVKAQNSKFNFV